MPALVPVRTQLDRTVFPLTTLAGAVGVSLVATADTTARHGYAGADLLFWLGFLCIVLPASFALLARELLRRDSIAIVCVVALDLYLVKVLHSPIRFTFYDEFSHWRDTLEILRTHHLFAPNPLLPLSSYFPGIENVIVALVQISHLPVFPIVIVAMALIRLFSTLCLYLLFEGIGGSTRLAAIGSVVFMGNPEYVFFSAQFSYKQLALPLAFFVLLLLLRRMMSHDHRLAYTLCMLLGLSATVITHHIVAYWLLLMIAGIEVAATVLRRRAGASAERMPGIGLLFLVGLLAWLVYVALSTVHTLKGQIDFGVSGVLKVIFREENTRQLFAAHAAGYATPFWERVVTIGVVGILVLALVGGLVEFLRNRPLTGFTLTFCATALVYPVALAFRLSPAGIETSQRLAELAFVSLALVVAGRILVIRTKASDRMRLPIALALALGVTGTVFNSVLNGYVPTTRLPGSYLVAADSRSIESEGIDAALWAQDALGPDNRIASDRTNRFLQATYGMQRSVLGGTDPLPIAPLYFSRTFTAADRRVIRLDRVQYVLVDLRISRASPLVPLFDVPNPGSGDKNNPVPIPRARLLKFGTLPGVNRVFDSGDIVIFDIRSLLNSGS